MKKTTMHAWQVNEFGHYKTVLQLGEVQQPSPKGKEILIKVHAAGINFPDLLSIAGTYQFKAPLPFIPGAEAVGTIVAIGEDSSAKIGERVMGMNLIGAFGEYMLLQEGSYFMVPDSMSNAEAAGFIITYQTSYFGLVHRAQLQAGETLLVHGGSGGVGVTAIQIGKALGATVVATAGSKEKLAVCRNMGADHVINYREEDFVKEVKEFTHGKGVNVIYDPVGGDVFDQSTKCIAWEGRLLVVGFTSGRIPEITANRLLLKNMSAIGVFWGAYLQQNPTLIHQTQQKLYEMYLQEKIKPLIYQEISFDQLPQALELIESRKSYGKIILHLE